MYVEPTVVANVSADMAIAKEEVFGPVLSILTFKTLDEAIELANSTLYGLSASLWTRDASLGDQLARRIEAGSVFVNGMVASDPRLPFGGVKQSGFGRELSSFGIREFVNIKTLWIGPAAAPQAPTAE